MAEGGFNSALVAGILDFRRVAKLVSVDRKCGESLTCEDQCGYEVIVHTFGEFWRQSLVEKHGGFVLPGQFWICSRRRVDIAGCAILFFIFYFYFNTCWISCELVGRFCDWLVGIAQCCRRLDSKLQSAEVSRGRMQSGSCRNFMKSCRFEEA